MIIYRLKLYGLTCVMISLLDLVPLRAWSNQLAAEDLLLVIPTCTTRHPLAQSARFWLRGAKVGVTGITGVESH
jgi:hypothetical protein